MNNSNHRYYEEYVRVLRQLLRSFVENFETGQTYSEVDQRFLDCYHAARMYVGLTGEEPLPWDASAAGRGDDFARKEALGGK